MFVQDKDTGKCICEPPNIPRKEIDSSISNSNSRNSVLHSTSVKQHKYVLDPHPVPQGSPVLPENNSLITNESTLPTLSRREQRRRSSSLTENSRRSTSGRLISIPRRIKNITDTSPLLSAISISTTSCKPLAQHSLGSDPLVTSLTVSIVECDPSEAPISAPSFSILPSLNESVHINTVRPHGSVSNSECVNNTSKRAEPPPIDEGDNYVALSTYHLQRAESEAISGSFSIPGQLSVKEGARNTEATPVERILAQSNKIITPQIEPYLLKAIAPPVYKTHHFKDRVIKPLTPQLLLNSDGMAVDDRGKHKNRAKTLGKHILIRASPPFKRLIQTPYGDFVTKFEYPSFNVTRYNTLSRMRWMSYMIAHFDHGLNPEQKMQPDISNIFCFQIEIYKLLKEALTSPQSKHSKSLVLSSQEMQNIVDGFECYYEEFNSLPRPVIIQAPPASSLENKKVEHYGGSSMTPFDPTFFHNDEFVYHVDSLGNQFGFNELRCPAPVKELLHNEDLAIEEADRVIAQIEALRTRVPVLVKEKPKRDKQMVALIAEHHKIDLFNPNLITPADTYTIVDKQCKIALNIPSPLPDGSVSTSELIRRGISLVAMERGIEMSSSKHNSYN